MILSACTGEPKSALSTQPSSSNAFDFDRGTEQGVSTFDDDEDDLEIRLDKIEAPNPEEEVCIPEAQLLIWIWKIHGLPSKFAFIWSLLCHGLVFAS